jgi:hypothetical protein
VLSDDGRVVDKKERDGDEDESDVQNTSAYQKSGIAIARLGWKDFLSVLLHSRTGLIPAVSAMVNSLVHEDPLIPSFSS